MNPQGEPIPIENSFLKRLKLYVSDVSNEIWEENQIGKLYENGLLKTTTANGYLVISLNEILPIIKTLQVTFIYLI